MLYTNDDQADEMLQPLWELKDTQPHQVEAVADLFLDVADAYAANG